MKKNLPAAVITIVAVTVSGPAPAAEAGAGGRSTEALVFNCFTCHGPGGRSPAAIPTINGKSAGYLLRRLNGFKNGKGEATIMDRIAKGYTDEELARMADYIAKLK